MPGIRQQRVLLYWPPPTKRKSQGFADRSTPHCTLGSKVILFDWYIFFKLKKSASGGKVLAKINCLFHRKSVLSEIISFRQFSSEVLVS